MKHIFSYDSKLMQFLSATADVFIVNILYILCCIPIVTVGAARTALHTVAAAWAGKENAGAAEFLRAFKEGFSGSTRVWLTMLGIGLFLTMDFLLLSRSELQMKNTLMYLIMVPTVFYLFCLSRIFEIISWFACSYAQYFRNAFFVSVANPITTILHIVFLLFPAAAFFMRPDIFTIVGMFWVLAYFSLEGYLDALLSKKMYEKLLKQTQTDADFEERNETEHETL